MKEMQYLVASQFSDGSTYVESPHNPMSREEAMNLLQVCRRKNDHKYVLLEIVEGV